MASRVAAASSATSRSVSVAEEPAGNQPIRVTPNAQQAQERKPCTLPQFEGYSVESTPGSKMEARLKVCLARLESEKGEWVQERKYQLTLKKLELEADTAIGIRQLELQANPHAPNIDRLSPVGHTAGFDISKNIHLVPIFRKSEVETYFPAFERIATVFAWPPDVWAILLQCRLTGKAKEACLSLSAADSLAYENLKGAIVRA